MKKGVISSLVSLAVFLSTTGPALANSDTAASALGNPARSVFNLFLSLAVIIVLIVFTVRYLARKTQVKQTGNIEVLAARQLAPNRFVEVIEVQGQRYLVGVGDQITLLADVTDTYIAGEAAEVNANFSQTLSDAIRSVREKYRRKDEGGPQG